MHCFHLFHLQLWMGKIGRLPLTTEKIMDRLLGRTVLPLSLLDQVVQKLDSPIHWINHHLVDTY